MVQTGNLNYSITAGNEEALLLLRVEVDRSGCALEAEQENLTVHTNYAERRIASTGSLQELSNPMCRNSSLGV
jgi:hypothetical protein